MRWAWIAVVMALRCGGLTATQAQKINLKAVQVEALAIRPNLISNAGFEEVGPDGFPAGWSWDRHNTDATCTVDTQVTHGGRRALKFTSTTPFGAHVYGMLVHPAPIRVTPGRAYTLSGWAKADVAGAVGLMGGGAWQFRAYAPPAGGQWRRFWTTFTPGEGDRDFIVRVSVEAPTKGIWLDDLKLEEGDVPSAVVPEETAGAPLELAAAAQETEIQGDGPFTVPFLLYMPRAMTFTAEANLPGAKRAKQALRLEPGAWRIVAQGTAQGVDDRPHTVTLTLKAQGQKPVEAAAKLRFYSPAFVRAQMEGLRKLVLPARRVLNRRRAMGGDVSYPQVGLTVLENFLGYIREDIQKGEVRRALQQINELKQESLSWIALLTEEMRLPAVPRWTGAKRPVVHGSSFVAPTRLKPGGPVVERPVFFNGYGHFGQVVADMEKWPGYGTNIIQIEIGPSVVFPSENEVNDEPIRTLRQTLDRAQKAGVAVCLLFSPHYIPGWALEKWPQLRKRREGFLQYCLHAPEGQALLKRFIATVLPPIKDHPALHSICLSNEPVNVEEPCDAARALWRDWLPQRHGDVAVMNARWGTSYATFDDAPLPNPYGPRPAPPVWMDYIRFNQEFFAGWHRMLADAIHEIAPGLPVHAKAMTWTLLNDGDVTYGVDATLFGGFSQINGNDAVNWYSFGSGEWAQGWQQNAMGHDLQRSVLDAPVFNSENHIIADRDTRPVPPEHVRAALWQAAVHGQSATTLWVWERTFDPRSDFAGSIMHRPACAAAVGLVNLDLNRAALQVTALQQAPPQAQILQGASAMVWDFGRSSDCRDKLYAALSFTGIKPGFITERQLEAGTVPTAPVLFVPSIVHLSDAAFAALKPYQGRIVMVGEGDMLTANEYNQPRADRLPAERLAFRYGPTTWRDLWTALRPKLPDWGMRPAVEVREGGQPAWGVEWRAAETDGGTVVNLCNYRHKPARLTLTRDGRPVKATDVLTGGSFNGTLTLHSLEVRLLRLRR